MKAAGVVVPAWALDSRRLAHETRECLLAFFRAVVAIGVRPWGGISVIKGFPAATVDRSKPLFWLESMSDLGPSRANSGRLIGTREYEDPPGVFTTYATVGSDNLVTGSWGVSAVAKAGGEDEVTVVVGALQRLFDPLKFFGNTYSELLWTQFGVELFDGAASIQLLEARLDLLGFRLGRVAVEDARPSFSNDLGEQVYTWVGNITLDVMSAKVQPYARV